MIDFSKHRFRASQMHLIMAGTIGLTEKQEDTKNRHLTRKWKAAEGALDSKGKPYKPLTDVMQKELDWLLERSHNPELPETMKKELHKIFYQVKYKRNFEFTNKYVQKGIQQEDEAITLYQDYRNKVLRIPTYFKKNSVRLEDDWFSGEPDIGLDDEIKNWKEGFDVKCSWDLSTFPHKKDDLIDNYEYQNQVYMHLTGAKKWTTVFCLVNATEHALFLEKQKWLYALRYGNTVPGEEGNPYTEQYHKKCRDCEIKMIYDYDRFQEHWAHLMEVSREEWMAEGYDIPMEDRVIEKVSIYDPEKIEKMQERIEIARKYLKSL